jgi:hypothetical protein
MKLAPISVYAHGREFHITVTLPPDVHDKRALELWKRALAASVAYLAAHELSERTLLGDREIEALSTQAPINPQNIERIAGSALTRDAGWPNLQRYPTLAALWHGVEKSMPDEEIDVDTLPLLAEPYDLSKLSRGERLRLARQTMLKLLSGENLTPAERASLHESRIRFQSS